MTSKTDDTDLQHCGLRRLKEGNKRVQDGKKLQVSNKQLQISDRDAGSEFQFCLQITTKLGFFSSKFVLADEKFWTITKNF